VVYEHSAGERDTLAGACGRSVACRCAVSERRHVKRERLTAAILLASGLPASSTAQASTCTTSVQQLCERVWAFFGAPRPPGFPRRERLKRACASLPPVCQGLEALAPADWNSNDKNLGSTAEKRTPFVNRSHKQRTYWTYACAPLTTPPKRIRCIRHRRGAWM
jgi:hypothetical protein